MHDDGLSGRYRLIWLKGCNKCRPHDDPIYWLFRRLLRLSLAVVPEHRWTVSERCVYQSLLTCGITLPHQSCKNFDSTRVLPPVRVIFSGNLRGYGGSAARYFWKAIIECISSLRCGVRYAKYGGGRLSTSVLFLISVCELECRWLMAKQCC